MTEQNGYVERIARAVAQAEQMRRFNEKIRLLELDDLRKAHTITPAEWSEYTSLVLALRSENRGNGGAAR